LLSTRAAHAAAIRSTRKSRSRRSWLVGLRELRSAPWIYAWRAKALTSRTTDGQRETHMKVLSALRMQQQSAAGRGAMCAVLWCAVLCAVCSYYTATATTRITQTVHSAQSTVHSQPPRPTCAGAACACFYRFSAPSSASLYWNVSRLLEVAAARAACGSRTPRRTQSPLFPCVPAARRASGQRTADSRFAIRISAGE
jgi:hypothetical protein